MNRPKVSVLVPIFNVEKYLQQCLDSVINQTLTEIEIICINDGSTDSSSKIIKEYASKDPRFVVINKKNSGYGDSMNKGLAKATGEYIGIVESDDFIESEMFEKLYELAKKNNAEVVKSNFFYYYADLSDTSPQWDASIGCVYNKERRTMVTEHDTKYGIVRSDEVGRIINPHKNQHIFYEKPAIWSAIYKHDFLRNHLIKFLPTPGASYQDTSFSFKVWTCAKRVVFTEDAFLHYRQDNEASSVNSSAKTFCVADEYHEIEKFLHKEDSTEELGSLAQRTKYGAYMWNFLRLADGLDADFLRLFAEEYRKADKEGILNYGYFDINQRRDLFEIMDNMKMFLTRKRAISKAKVSVIVPVYNSEKYLARCLDSLLGQTLKDIEIICVNDGSVDDSLRVLERYYHKDPRIVLRDRPKSGVSRARNHGMSKVSSDFIMFCDSDDYYSPDACGKMYKAITDSHADLAVCGINIVYSHPKLNVYRHSDEEYYKLKFDGMAKITENVMKKTDLSLCSKIFRSALQKKYEIWFPGGMWYEDAKFLFDYMLVSHTAYYLQDEKLYTYVRRLDSIMATTAQKTPQAIDHTKIIIGSFHFMKRHDLLRGHEQLFIDYFISGYKFSLRFMPEETHERLYGLISEFLKNNGSYLDSIDPTISAKIKDLLPVFSTKAKVKRTVTQVIKKPVRAILPKVSFSYRAQNRIIDRTNDINKKIEELSISTDKKLDTVSEQLEAIQRAISEMNIKK